MIPRAEKQGTKGTACNRIVGRLLIQNLETRAIECTHQEKGWQIGEILIEISKASVGDRRSFGFFKPRGMGSQSKIQYMHM